MVSCSRTISKPPKTNAHGDVHAVKKGCALRTQRGDSDPVSPTASTHRWEKKVGIQSDLDLFFPLCFVRDWENKIKALKVSLGISKLSSNEAVLRCMFVFCCLIKEERETGAVGTFSEKKKTNAKSVDYVMA